MNKGKLISIILHIVVLQIMIKIGLYLFPEIPEMELVWPITGLYIITAVLCGFCNAIEKVYREK